MNKVKKIAGKNIEQAGGKNFKFLMYRASDEDVSVNAAIKDKTIWLPQKGMAGLFGCLSDNISLHLKNIFETRELVKETVTEKISAIPTAKRN